VADEWDLKPGDKIVRRELHRIYGGGWYGGMEPSGKTPNVLLFTDPAAGKKFGYHFDGWHPDGTFHYTGEGQVGDQEMREGNRAVRDHIDEGRALRLFKKAGTEVVYIGEFEVPDDSHWLIDEAPDSAGNLRSVFVFRLKAVGATLVNPGIDAPPLTLVQTVPVEASNVDRYVVQREVAEPTEALRTEALLVGRYVEWLDRRRGATVDRQAIPTAAGRLMYTDIYVRETGELIEAKSSSSREHLRLALGQILDYARYVDHTRLAVLVPTRPSQDMVDLLLAHNIASIWEKEEKGDFESVRPADAWDERR
jgi:hypothetical protein